MRLDAGVGPALDIDGGPPVDGGGGVDAGPAEPTCAPAMDGAYADAADMQVARTRHTATRLKDGRVLIVGGQDDVVGPSTTAEIFDPADGTFTRTVGDLVHGRYDHAAALLPDGRVALFGGFEMSHLDSVELWDPATGLFTETTAMPQARVGATATELPDGRVVIIGGINDVAAPATVLVFDPTDASFTQPTEISTGRNSHSTVLLDDGRLMVMGGYLAGLLDRVDIVAADLASSTVGASLPSPRRSVAATALPGGEVLVAGGYGPGGGQVLDDAWTWDAATGAWSAAGRLRAARFAPGVVALSCAALVCGGIGPDAAPAVGCEAWDFDARAFVDVAGPDAANLFSFTMTPLADGAVLFAGGTDDVDWVRIGASLFTPAD